ncbi:hypothetical protein [Paenibacillus sp. HB172176]|uniref:hypothetical protein n=1 Tax=Paenibacillus sp. HB172176 TaxID=2493690 RepID=UPI0014392E23|nr:hypothetical protein [Paenibacillus sp. HB172176]
MIRIMLLLSLTALLTACSFHSVEYRSAEGTDVISENGELSDSENAEAAPEDIKDEDTPVSSEEGTSFDEESAAEAVLKEHPDFPSVGQFKTIETMTGGPAPGTKVSGTLTTRADAAEDEGTYIITLTKQWNMTINDKELIGRWVYKVSQGSIELLESEDNTDQIGMVK